MEENFHVQLTELEKNLSLVNQQLRELADLPLFDFDQIPIQD